MESRSAEAIFTDLETLGYDALEMIRKEAFTPNINKSLRTWGISDASLMIKRSGTHIRNYLKKNNKYPDSSGTKKLLKFSLSEINEIRANFKTSPPHSDNPAIIAFANFKGGAAKTTTAVHTAQYFALKGYRVLLIDCDSQGSATQMFGYNPDEEIKNDQTLLPILLQTTSSIKSVIRHTYWDGLDLIPANLALYGAEFAIPERMAIAKEKNEDFHFYSILATYMEQIKDQYDLIVLDCPPSMGTISTNAIYAANSFIIPVPPSMLDFTSTIQFFAMVREILSSLPNKQYSFVRLLITKHDNQESSNNLVDILRALYGKFVLRNMMFTSEAIKKSSNDLLTLYEIDKYPGTKATFNRAINYMNDVNDEILSLTKKCGV